MDYSKIDNVEATVDKGPSIKFRNGYWWWADETWAWHGPCHTEKSARSRQNLYIQSEIEGTCAVRYKKDWEEMTNKEPLDTIHPCDNWAPWDCMCAGACSCHFIERNTEAANAT
jgi:hypothetical protein